MLAAIMNDGAWYQHEKENIFSDTQKLFHYICMYTVTHKINLTKLYGAYTYP